MRPLLVYKADDGWFVAPEAPDPDAALLERVSEFFKTRKAAQDARDGLFDEFQRTGVYPQRVAG